MLIHYISSLVDKFKENKIRNPFIGTYLIIWFLRNWMLFYIIRNFEEKDTLQKK